MTINIKANKPTINMILLDFGERSMKFSMIGFVATLGDQLVDSPTARGLIAFPFLEKISVLRGLSSGTFTPG